MARQDWRQLPADRRSLLANSRRRLGHVPNIQNHPKGASNFQSSKNRQFWDACGPQGVTNWRLFKGASALDGFIHVFTHSFHIFSVQGRPEDRGEKEEGRIHRFSEDNRAIASRTRRSHRTDFFYGSLCHEFSFFLCFVVFLYDE